MPSFQGPKSNQPSQAPSLDSSAVGVGQERERGSTQRELMERTLLSRNTEKLAPERVSTVLAELADPNARALLIGENHLSHATRDLLRVNLPALREKGFTTLGVEFPTSLQDQFSRLNRGQLSPDEVRELVTTSQETFGPKTTEAFLALVLEARRLGMRVIPIDPGNNTPKEGSVEAAEREFIFAGGASQEVAAKYFTKRVVDRSQKMGGELLNELTKNPNTKVVALVGAAHLSMDGEKTLKPPKYEGFAVPLLNNGADSAVRSRGIPATAVVVAQRVPIPSRFAGYTEPTLVDQVLSVSKGELGIVHTSRAGRPGGVHAFVTLPSDPQEVK